MWRYIEYMGLGLTCPRFGVPSFHPFCNALAMTSKVCVFWNPEFKSEGCCKKLLLLRYSIAILIFRSWLSRIVFASFSLAQPPFWIVPYNLHSKLLGINRNYYGLCERTARGMQLGIKEGKSQFTNFIQFHDRLRSMLETSLKLPI